MTLRVTACALAVLTASACTPTHYKLQPYRDDVTKADVLSARAAQVCAARRGSTDLPPVAFTSDGCSMWPNDGWVDCCVEHDIAYWCGGSGDDRLQADATLRQCVAQAHSATLAWLMFIGVRWGGLPWQPAPWRWAYGWYGIHGYDDPAPWRHDLELSPQSWGGSAHAH